MQVTQGQSSSIKMAQRNNYPGTINLIVPMNNEGFWQLVEELSL
jgi:hypothetical protein